MGLTFQSLYVLLQWFMVLSLCRFLSFFLFFVIMGYLFLGTKSLMQCELLREKSLLVQTTARFTSS